MKKNVAIYGIGGLYNFGCEAILRGTVKYIKKIYGDNTNIIYYSRNIEDDSKITEQIDINIVDISRKNGVFKRIVSKAVDILEIPIIPFFKREFNKIIDESDVIISVGGDIYTIPNYLRKNKKYRYVNYLVEFGEEALRKGKKVIIYGASIGPFGQYERAVNYYINHLKKIDQVICREMESVEYLKSHGVSENVAFLPDPAFLVDKSNDKNLTNYVGINLSELSLNEIYGKVTETEISVICNLMEEIYEKTNLPLMLIPHVLSPHTPLDNDYLFLKKIYGKLSADFKKNIILVKPKNFLDAKQYLKQCKFVIAARMHCAVNASIEGIPTIFLTYSQKSKGMAQFIYGSENLCIPMQEIDKKLIFTVKELEKNYEKIRLNLEKRITEVEKNYNDYFDDFE